MSNTVISTNQLFETTDLSLASALLLWYPLQAIDKENPSKAKFVFLRDEYLDETVEKYWRRELRIEPQTFFASLRSIKARLYE